MIGLLQNLVDAASLGSLYALAALGVGLLFGILRLVNFAHGDFISIGAYALIVPSFEVTAQLFIGTWSWWLMIPTITLIVVIVALISDALVFRPLRRASAPTLMIASFAVSYVIQTGILLVYGARPKAANLWAGLDTPLMVGDVRVPLLQVITIVATLVLMAALTLFLKRTRYGTMMRAAAEDFRMAQYLGVRGDFVIGLAFAISGVLATAVSLLYLSQTGTLSPTMGVPLALFAFVATVIGGMGSLLGAVVGGFVVGVVVIMLQAYLPADLRAFRDAFAFTFVILILLVRPSGIIRTRALVERV
ncbi:MAG: branched-chain amino acid ABC transporter permease [Alphaproteobacteria bacterium]|nr:branched-chain amino acid ABC transporter permease [Alphaproteobacteria bacterium]